jgi:hemolysin activation/secretion protein
VELAAGTSAGRVPVQSRWSLGGPATLRGYGGGAQTGDAFWRARVEVANRSPAARLALFADVGRAGARDRLSLRRPLVGAGIGASFVDGLLRVDLARALRSPTGWRLDCYVDGAL